LIVQQNGKLPIGLTSYRDISVPFATFHSIANCPNRVNFRHRTTKWPNSLHSLFRQNL